MGSSRKRKRRNDPYEYAKLLMRYRPRSVEEMKRRISEKFGEDVAEMVVSELEKRGILDDGEFALMFARSEILSKLHGPRSVRMKLRRLGVAEDLIETAINEAMEEFDAKGVFKDLFRKFKDARKVRDYLYRRGFDPSLFGDIEVDE